MNKNVFKKALTACLPVISSFIVIGIGFGVVVQSRGYGALWAGAMSLFIYAGSMQFVALELIGSGASLLTAAITTVMVNLRHVFYGLSMVDKYKDVGKAKPYLIYALSGFFAGLAGIVLLSRSGSAQTTVGKGLEFDVITCVVLGGVSVNGGVGRISGVIAGVLIIGSLTNGMILLNVSEYIQMVVKGLVLAAAVGLDCMSNKRKTN